MSPKAEQRHARLEAGKTLLTLCTNCANAANHFCEEFCDRNSIYTIATGEKHFDFEELHALQNGFAGIPLYQLPDVLVSPAMVIAASLRQLAYSAASRPPIPIEAGHPFRFKSATHSE